MKQTVTSSLRWAGAGRLASQLITWSVTIIVVRILLPEDYGLMAVASMVVGFFSVFDDIGMSAAIVNKKTIDDDVLRSIFGLVLLFGISVFAAMFGLAYVVALVFEDERLVEIVQVLSIVVPLSSLGAVPAALLERRMDFKSKSVVEFAAVTAGSITTLSFALSGGGVWSLVFGTLTNSSVQLVGFWLVVPESVLPRFQFRKIRSEVSFGSFVAFDRIIYYFYSQADRFFVGKFLGLEVLGIYSVAMQLATLPMSKVGAIINKVGFSAFSRVQSNLQELRWGLLKAIESLALVGFAVFFGMAAVSPHIVDVLLNEKWESVALPLTILALAMPLRLINSTTPAFLFGIGEAREATKNSAIATVVMVPILGAASIWGDLAAVCYGWLIGYPVYFVICLRRALPKISLALTTYLSRIWHYSVIGIVMLIVVRLVDVTLKHYVVVPSVELVLLVFVGAAVYLGLLWVFGRKKLVEIYRLAVG